MSESLPIVVVVGAGNLGSRHLQGLARVQSPLTIFAVDPAEPSRQLAQVRFDEIPGRERHTLHLLEQIEQLPGRVDLAIVSTSAHVRYEMVERLAAASHVRYWLLEKILFQREKHCQSVQSLLRNATGAWVNCTQRLWPFFLALKDEARAGARIQLEMFGSNWGLASNAIHNLDIAEFLWGRDYSTAIEAEGGLISSKRSGFKEFNGRIETRAAQGGIRQFSLGDGQHPFTISCQTESAALVWDVTHSLITERRASAAWQPMVSPMAAPFQSSLTATVTDGILRDGKCSLPTLAESVGTHLHFFAALKAAAPVPLHEANGIFPFT